MRKIMTIIIAAVGAAAAVTGAAFAVRAATLRKKETETDELIGSETNTRNGKSTDAEIYENLMKEYAKQILSGKVKYVYSLTDVLHIQRYDPAIRVSYDAEKDAYRMNLRK